MTDSQSASLSWDKAPIWGLRPHFYCRQTVAGFLMWSALSDETTGLSFTIAGGPRQRSHSRVRVLWDSRPYFTVSDSRLPFSSPPTTRRATVEVFDPASTQNSTPLYPLCTDPTKNTVSQQFVGFFTAPLSRSGLPIVSTVRFWGNEFSDPLPSNRRGADYIENNFCNTFSTVACAYFGRCLEMGLHVTVYYN
jgi:hypothetical protein